MITGQWNIPATVERNRFIYKSLSSWAYNIAVGCEHACRFCYVPEASTRKLVGPLSKRGVEDPDSEWGEYVFIRPFEEGALRRSIIKAQQTPDAELNPDGNRAVFLCSTTDPYQVIPPTTNNPAGLIDAAQLREHRKQVVRRGLEMIGTLSTLNVRILTRSPLAEMDFELFQQLGKRCMFGMSLPTLNNNLARIYEPKAPAPTARYRTLLRAAEAGLNVYVAVAPVYPECDKKDMLETLTAIKKLNPMTIFMEPINIRAENVARIADHAARIGQKVNTDVFSSPERWREYAINQLRDFEWTAQHVGLADRLHLWPDKSLGQNADPHLRDWLLSWWNRISEWPH